jgi:hypothetical protein
MPKRLTHIICLLSLLWLANGVQLGAQTEAQGKPAVYTYVSQWAVPRAQWGDMATLASQERPLMDKLLADGTITNYGSFTDLIHQEGEPTHGEWFSATSEANLMKVREALDARPDLTAPVLAASRHWDSILVSRTYNARSGKADGAYLTVSTWDLKPGEAREFRELVNGAMVPVLEKLLADGVVLSYATETEDYHTQKMGYVELVLTTADASGLDKVGQAFDTAFDKNPALSAAFRSMVEREGHRDFLLRVNHMAFK